VKTEKKNRDGHVGEFMRQRTCAWQLTKTLAIGVQKST